MKNIGKPCAGKPHARFDEGGQVKTCSLLYPNIGRAKPKALARGRRKESRLAGKASTSRPAATGQEEERVAGTIHRSVR